MAKKSGLNFKDEKEFAKEWTPNKLSPSALKQIVELRVAFDLTVKDERFQTDAARMKIEANSSSGPEVEHVLRQVYATPPAIVKRAREIMN